MHQLPHMALAMAAQPDAKAFSRVTRPVTLPHASTQAVAAAVMAVCVMHAMPQAAWADDATLPAVAVRAQAQREPRASITGMGDTPAWQTPLQAQSIKADALSNAQVQRLADITKLDASTSDAYNTVGYWDSLSMRGFVLDNKSNYRRGGLPINAETRIALDNKSAVELFKGTSGLQAGTSAPGGLVNLLVKRPEGKLRQAELAFTGGSSVKTAVDLSDRFGATQQYGLRINAATERLAPEVQAAKGHEHLLAVAANWAVSSDTSLDAEFEHSLHRQPSVPGLSALGNTVPSASQISPATNLNQQPWTLPVDMRSNTGSLRWQQRWSPQWRSVVSYGEQHLRSQDRVAFPFGCSNESTYLADRVCSDGSFDLYDFRSENERRTTRALQAQLMGQLQLGSQRHDITLGVLRSQHTTDVSSQAFNYAGSASISNPTAPTTADPALTYADADRHERSTEWLLQDAIMFSESWRAWAGLRHTRLERTSSPTDGSAATQRSQNLTTPWLALGYSVAPQTQVYASWGEGAEVKTAPRSNSVTNSGQIMPAAKSRQAEIGIKGQRTAEQSSQQWSANWFRIQRPELAVVGSSFQADGQAVHEGLEGQWQAQYGALGVSASAMLIDAKRRGSANNVNGKAPTNVPEHSVKFSGSYKLPASMASGLLTTLQADVVHEGPRWADPDNTLRVQAWTRIDASLKAVQKISQTDVTWRLGVSNLLDTRAWRESPNNSSHIWLFPLAARTWTASAQINF